MAEALKILGQAAPAATTSSDLYTVPAATQTTVSTLAVANRASTATTFRISIAKAGEALANKQYIYYDQFIDGNSSFLVTIGITLQATDVIRVYAGTANLSFNVFGIEVS
jgi:hypothetical protein